MQQQWQIRKGTFLSLSYLTNDRLTTQASNVTILDQKAATNPYLLSMGSQARALAPVRIKREFNWTEPGQYVSKGEELREEIKNERFLKLEASIKSEEVTIRFEASINFQNKKNAALLESQIREEQAEEFKREEKFAVIGKVPTVEWWDKPFLLGNARI